MSTTTTTVRSTTGTAPLTFTPRRLGEVEILHEDGSAQVYDVESLRRALAALPA
jgi:hypothetical protein